MNSKILANIPIFEEPSEHQKRMKSLFLILVITAGFSAWSSDPFNMNFQALLDNNPKSIWIHAPSMACIGEEIEITVEIWDFCERLDSGYDKEVMFSSTDPNAELPGPYRFIPSGINQGMILAQDLWPGDKGIKTFTIKLYSLGIHYINILESEGSLKGTSNPILVYDPDSPPEYFLYWGDIHSHTSRCDGSGYLSEALYYAKEIAKCDFAAVTTHDHFIEPWIGGLAWNSYWNNHKQIVNQWNKENEFVTLQAYEYRGELFRPNSVGDMCIYSNSDDIPYFPGHLEQYTTPNLLFDSLRSWKNTTGSNILAIPHHPPHAMKGLTFDWSYFDPEFIKLVEIYSVHGSSELSNGRHDGENRFPLIGVKNGRIINQEINTPGHHIQDALAMGFKVGFMASGDSHDGRPGHSISHTQANHLLQAPLSWGALPHLFRIHHNYPNGMIAAYSTNLSRTAIFDALYTRRVYAVKGVSRPFINFSINGVGVGINDSTIYLPSNTSTRHISLQIAVGGGYGNEIERIIIYKNNRIWQNIACYNRTASFSLVDTEEIQPMRYEIEKYGVLKNGKQFINSDADIYLNPETLNTNGSSVYYAKMYDTQGGIAWIGPFWVGQN